MTDHYHVFLSYSRNDLEAADSLRDQLERSGLSVFRDQDSIREGDLWLNRLQEAVGACGSFVVLIGRDGIRRWIGAETQVALSRYFSPQVDAQRLPIFPILLGGTQPEGLPAFLRLFQATPWNGNDRLPGQLLEQIRDRTLTANDAVRFEGCPFVGLDAYRVDQAQLFFGRQKETLDALACFDTSRGSPTVRWIEINGNSGAGKSSLMNAGLLPLVDQGWLWPRTGYPLWRRIGPMMPGEQPVTMLAEQLGRAFGEEMGDVRRRLEGDERALAEWLRSRKQPETAFLLAIDQFEELFTFAASEQRQVFDRLLAGALEDTECPLFVMSTVRADFLDRFDDLPRLVAARNRLARPWSLPPIGADGLREVISGPARLAGLDVSDVLEAMVGEARDEPGALPLVENALHWLWDRREGNRLSGRLFNGQGGLAGILSHSADDLLGGLGKQKPRALKLLFELVNVDPEGRRHARRRLPLAEAVAVAGGGERGHDLVSRLAGERARDGGKARGPLRLITVSDAEEIRTNGSDGKTRWVNLIHETLIRSKGRDQQGKPQGYWPTLWGYIEDHKERAAQRERLRLQARQWASRASWRRWLSAANMRDLGDFRGLGTAPDEKRYLRRGRAILALKVILAGLALLPLIAGLWQVRQYGLPLDYIPSLWSYWLGSPPTPSLQRIDAGAFTMGSKHPGAPAGEQPAHPVNIEKPFYIARHEVTFLEYDFFVMATDRRHERTGKLLFPKDEKWGRGKQPVINVSRQDARDYADWLTSQLDGRGACRLPSEAEWEYAARSGTTTEYALPAPHGSEEIRAKGLANCDGCGSQWDGEQAAPVGSFNPNAWGLYDMHGNVEEWVEDCWHGSYEGTPADGRPWLEEGGGDCGSRVLRGGSWDYNPGLLRSAYRGSYRRNPDYRSHFIGFRVLCSGPL